jgi:hypothetical protein
MNQKNAETKEDLGKEEMNIKNGTESAAHTMR